MKTYFRLLPLVRRPGGGAHDSLERACNYSLQLSNIKQFHIPKAPVWSLTNGYHGTSVVPANRLINLVTKHSYLKLKIFGSTPYICRSNLTHDHS